MINIFTNIINYIVDITGENGKASAKRWAGFIIIFDILHLLNTSVENNGFGEHEAFIAEMLVGVAGVLLGISTVMNNIGKSKNNTQSTGENKENDNGD